MESKRAAAPNGPQAAWPRCHRTNTKPGRRQRCTPPAASRRRPRAPAFWAVIAGEVRPKGQVRAKGQVRPKVGAGHRGPFLQAVQSHARAVHPRARSVRGRANCSSARATRASRRSIAVGVEIIGVSFFRPMSSEGGGRLSIRSTSRQHSAQSCPKNGRMMEKYGIPWR